MKILITVLALLNGGFMLIDGVHVLLKGKYIGSEKPGLWADVFQKLNFDVFKLEPLFMVFGTVWLIWLFGLWTGSSWTYSLGIAVSILTLWYLPFGTLISLIILTLLLIWRKTLGI